MKALQFENYSKFVKDGTPVCFYSPGFFLFYFLLLKQFTWWQQKSIPIVFNKVSAIQMARFSVNE